MMESNMSTTTTMTFPTAESLAEWLKPRIPEEKMKTWGVKPGTKNIHNLWLEVKEGESVLNESSPQLRTVRCVGVRIPGPDDTFLVESFEEMSNGSIRRRYRDLFKKLKPNETDIEAAARRAVKEELGSVLPLDVKKIEQLVRIIPGSLTVFHEEDKNPDSYPGLSTHYVVNHIDAFVEGLPKTNFFTVKDEYAEHGDAMVMKLVTVRKHYWTWDVDLLFRFYFGK